MSALLRAELLRLRTTRTFAAFVGVALGLSALVVALSAALFPEVAPEDAEVILSSDVSGLLVLLLAVIGTTGEWRHRTIMSSFLAAPNRAGLLVAKAIAYAVAGVLLALAVNLVVYALGTLILSARGQATLSAGQLVDLLWRTVLAAGLGGALGVGLGSVVRNQAAAIVTVLVLLFIVEPTLLAVAPEVGKFGPLIGAPVAIAGDGLTGAESGAEMMGTLSPGLGALVLLGWTVLLVGAGAALLGRRDLT